MRTLEARYKSDQRCHCRCDLGEKTSPCLREIVFSCACAWNLITKRRYCVSQGFHESTHSRCESYAMQIPPRTRPWSVARHPNACLRELVFSIPLFERDIHEESEAGRRDLRSKVKRSAPRRARKTSLPIKLPFRYYSTFPYRPPCFLISLREWLYLFNYDPRVSAREWDDIRGSQINRAITIPRFFPKSVSTTLMCIWNSLVIYYNNISLWVIPLN